MSVTIIEMTNKPATLRTRVSRVNREVADLLRNKYWDSLPICDVCAIAEKHGFRTDDFDGIYVGSKGRTVADMGENVWMTFIWCRTGDRNRFEVVAYCSKGVS